MTWFIWVAGAVVLAAAAFGAVYLPQRGRGLERRTAWSVARAAVDSAAISRDAAPHLVPEAEDLFARARLLVAVGGESGAAAEAAECAARADRLWRWAAGG